MNVFDVFILLIAGVSYVAVLFLVFNSFNPLYTIITGTFIVCILVKVLGLSIGLYLPKVPYALIVILLIALVLRFQPYLYVPGGQDQGVYVNMSAVYERTGSTFVTDDVRSRAIDSDLKEWYDSANQVHTTMVKKGKYEGVHLPGIYIKNLSNSEYVFQFYPLHPLWMAIFGKFFGTTNRVYSLVFFSLLSITGFYLLARELSGGKETSAIIVSLLLALNPLHSFFSKFPVTEVITLSLSSLSFLYLVKYYSQARAGQSQPFFLVLSALLFGCMFFTHIRGFLYIPFIYFIILVTLLFEQKKQIRKNLIFYAISLFGLYAISVLYGMIFSYPYSHDIYNINMSKLFTSSWPLKVTATILGGIALLLFFLPFRRRMAKFRETNLRDSIVTYAAIILCVAVTLIMLMAIYKTYVFSFTDNYGDARWNIGGQGWDSFVYSNFVVTMWYLSPIGLIMFIYYIYWVFPKNNNVPAMFFVGFLCMAWYCGTIIKYTTPYQYYYARYLLVDVVPYTLLAVSFGLGYLFEKAGWRKTVSMAMISVISLYFLIFALHQFKGKSADGAHAAFTSIDEVVDKKDLLLLYKLYDPHPLVAQTSLSYFYNLNVCNIVKPSILDGKRGKAFLSKFDEVFLLSQAPLSVPSLLPVKGVEYKQGKFQESNFIPTRFYFKGGYLYLYKVINF